MLNLLRKLFGMCEHEWQYKKTIGTLGFGFRDAFIEIYQCKNCLKIKKIKY